MKQFFELVNKNFELYYKHVFGAKPIERSNNRPLITISRQMGAGGKVIADIVAKRLGPDWKVFHKEIIDEIAKAAKVNKEIVEEVDGRRKTVIDELVFNALGKRFMNLTAYNRLLLHTLSYIGTRGYAIIIGRGAHFLFPNALKIRVISNVKNRIKSLMKYDKLTRKEAEKHIIESDEERHNYIRTVFKHDHNDINNFDLVIKTGQNMKIDSAADLVVQVAKNKFK